MARRPIRIAVLYFVHETVTFLRNDTTLDDFVYEGSPAKGEALLAQEPKSYMGGFVKVAREFAGVELVGIESPLWPRTGTGSGWITTRGLRDLRRPDDRRAHGDRPLDGRRLSQPARRHGRARRAAARGGHRAAGARGRGQQGLHRRHLRSARQRGRGVPAPGRHGLHREILPALRQPPAGRARGAHAGARHPRRLQARHRHAEACRSSRRPCCNGPAPRRGWTWCSAR